jgi:hypothetical protein
MRLDDLARQAADQAREQAARAGNLDPEAYRGSRQRRTQRRGLLVAGTFVTAALVVAIVVSPPEEDLAAPTTTSIPGVVSTTVPSVTTTTIGPEPSTGPPPLGAGWEELDPGPIAGRYRTAAVWTDHGLFVWGGHDNYRQEDPAPVLYHGNGFLYDPAIETWSAITPPGQEFFEVGEARAVSMGDRVFVYGRPRAPGSGSAAIYDLQVDEWTPVAPEFGDSLGPGVQVVWTGELLVATNIALAYDPVTGTTLTHLDDGMMATPADADATVHSPQRAHWTGSEILVVGSGPVYAWVPGEDAEWRTLTQPPVPARARDSVWTDRGLLVVNYQMAAAVLDRDTSVWSRPGDLPLRFYECLPEAVSAGGTPVVRMCSGIAIWDEVRDFWVPILLSDLGMDPQGSVPLVGADDAIYTVGGDTFRRFAIERASDGSIVPPPTVPIGVAELDIPSGWELISSFAPEQSPEGFIPEDETIGLVFLSSTATCTVTSTYAPDGWSPPAGFIELGSGFIDSPGRTVLPANEYRGADHDGWAAAVPTSTSDVVFIHCQKGPDPSHFAGAVTTFHLSLRSALVEVGTQIVIGTGWEELDESPVAGRMRTAVVWTGSEIFVWGGHDGYSQETPSVARFHQEAYLFDPTTGVWRMASDPPDGLCPLTDASVVWMGDAVLLVGGAVGSDCLSRSATYDPVGDTWTVLEGGFYDLVPLFAEVVWTGQWLAAPAFGVAWVPGQGAGEFIEIPIVPGAASDVGSPTMFHWDGERIIAIGAGDVYGLVPGADSWDNLTPLAISVDGRRIGAAGRRSVLTEHGLFVVTRDGEGARVVDLAEVNLDNLPLRLSECDAFLVAAGDLPVAQVGCSGMAIWDPVRGFWVPIPMDLLSGAAWQSTLVGTDDAVYSLGEKVLRYPIERLGDGSVANPEAIPVGVMQLEIPPGFWLRSTVGNTTVEWPDGSYGEVVAIAFEAPRGTCHVAARYGGPEIRVSASVIVDGAAVPLPVFNYYDTESDTWVIVSGSSDSIWVNCDSDADARLLVAGFWLP